MKPEMRPALFIVLLLLACFTLQYCSSEGTTTVNTMERIMDDDDDNVPPDDDDYSDDDLADDDDSDDDSNHDDDIIDDDDDITDDDDDDDTTECCVAGDPCDWAENGKCDCPSNLWDWKDCLNPDDDDDDDNDTVVDDDDDDDTAPPPDIPYNHRTYWPLCFICHPGIHNGWYTPPDDCLICHSQGTDCTNPQGPQPPGNHEPGGPYFIDNCTMCHESEHYGQYNYDPAFCTVCHQRSVDCV